MKIHGNILFCTRIPMIMDPVCDTKSYCWKDEASQTEIKKGTSKKK